MIIKVKDTPDDLFEYMADVVPRKDDFIFYKGHGYKVSYVCHYVEEVPDKDKLEEAYALVEVSTTRTFLGQQIIS